VKYLTEMETISDFLFLPHEKKKLPSLNVHIVTDMTGRRPELRAGE
jgi:hypothetical protein